MEKNTIIPYLGEKAFRHPNFFLVGAMRSGTTSIHNLLNSHSDIFMSPIKEPNYFSKDLWDKVGWTGSLSETWVKKQLSHGFDKKAHSANVRSWSDYLLLFSQAETESLIGEASPSYLMSKVAAEEISKKFPQAKVLMILRDPIQRAYSHFRMLIAQNEISDTFENALNLEFNEIIQGHETTFGLVEGGLYCDQIKRYLRFFDNPGQVKVVLFDDIQIRTPEICLGIAGFLGIDPEGYGEEHMLHKNPTRLPRSDKFNSILQKTRLKALIRNIFPKALLDRGKNHYYTRTKEIKIDYKKLANVISFFNDDITKLSALINRDLSEWKRAV